MSQAIGPDSDGLGGIATFQRGGPATGAAYSETVGSGELVLCPFPDHDVLCDPADDKIGARLLSGRPYQRRHIDDALAILAAAGRLPPDGVFLDIGANIGTMTLYAMCSGRFSAALAIEPDPRNHSILRRNLALNNLSGRVVALSAAAGAAAGRVLLNIAARNRGAHSVRPLGRAAPAGRTIDVAMTTADAAVQLSFARTPVTLAKIDVEGYELAVLDGMRGLLAVGVPLLIEVTSAVGESADLRFAALRGRLGPCYRSVIDIQGAAAGGPSAPVPLAAFRARVSQHDLLIY
ncbi:MAG: FkbM family methyltransferase [Hyphomicrobiaceae bacterium]